MINEFRNLIALEKNNPELQSTIDIPTLLRAAENVDIDYLSNHTLADISQEVVQALQFAQISKNDIAEFCEKLTEYRLVDQIFQLHKGKHVRWVRMGSPRLCLTNGGIVVNVKFLDNGTHILCKNGPRFIQYKFDDCITFQKLSADEQMILSCYELLKKHNS